MVTMVALYLLKSGRGGREVPWLKSKVIRSSKLVGCSQGTFFVVFRKICQK